jgi:hypothetical protein
MGILSFPESEANFLYARTWDYMKKVDLWFIWALSCDEAKAMLASRKDGLIWWQLSLITIVSLPLLSAEGLCYLI